MNFNDILMLISTTFMYSTPLIFAAIGGVISERSGVVNIGIEGMMSIGAFTGAAVGYFTGNPLLGLLCAGLSGAGLALFHAVASITFLADQTVSGIAINLIGPGVAMFLSRLFFSGATQTLPISTKLPKFFGIDATSYIAILVVIFTAYFMKNTMWGLRIRALGEHPAAVDTVGVSVTKMRYVCVLMSGFLAGIGGGVVTLSISSMFTPTSICGQGFIALAAVIFGKWRSFGACFACLFFGLFQVLSAQFGNNALNISSDVLNMMPYILTILVLIFFVGKSSAPRASGQPYEKGVR